MSTTPTVRCSSTNHRHRPRRRPRARRQVDAGPPPHHRVLRHRQHDRAGRHRGPTHQNPRHGGSLCPRAGAAHRTRRRHGYAHQAARLLPKKVVGRDGAPLACAHARRHPDPLPTLDAAPGLGGPLHRGARPPRRDRAVRQRRLGHAGARLGRRHAGGGRRRARTAGHRPAVGGRGARRTAGGRVAGGHPGGELRGALHGPPPPVPAGPRGGPAGSRRGGRAGRVATHARPVVRVVAPVDDGRLRGAARLGHLGAGAARPAGGAARPCPARRAGAGAAGRRGARRRTDPHRPGDARRAGPPAVAAGRRGRCDGVPAGRAAGAAERRGRRHPDQRSPGPHGTARGGDAPARRRSGRAGGRTARADPRRPAPAGGGGAGGRSARRDRRRARAVGRATGADGSHRVPDRAGGADQRPQARRRPRGHPRPRRRAGVGTAHRRPQRDRGRARGRGPTPGRPGQRAHRSGRAGGARGRPADPPRRRQRPLPPRRVAAVVEVTGPIRVVVVDDDPLVRGMLTMMLDGADGIAVVGEAADGDEAVTAVDRHTPDVVLMDIRMPRVSGITATERLRRRPRPPEIIVLTTFDTDDHVVRALRAGASGFLLKDTPPERISQAVHAVAAGMPILSPSVTRRLMRHVASGAEAYEEARARLGLLTERERDVVVAIGQGRANAEIARDLLMSVTTVKAHVSHILTKLDLTNRTQIALLAHDGRLV
ncbi:DNA-binding response regulator [Micromonospora globbae]|uniref:DNA-binding response regulator n=1 Tax=Micromonospora globbae TaxID=1894969 RepID=A0A420F966_9ACTN|nr:DNA-binding response regulator [Micromonospora globbae]